MITLKSKDLSISVKTDKFNAVTEVCIDRNGSKPFKYNTVVEFIDGENSPIPKDSPSDFERKEVRKAYIDLLKKKFNDVENFVILSGAGSSVGIGKEQVGLTMSQLWDTLNKEKPDALKELITETGYSEKEGDLEALLSMAFLRMKADKPNLKVSIDLVKQFIGDKCTLNQKPDSSPHHMFLEKITLRPQKFPRVKIFTLNYDTLFEQAAATGKFTVMDGFSFSSPREFNGKYFDYDLIETRHNRQDKHDSIIPKLFYLLKMHGSLNWKTEDEGITIQQDDSPKIDLEKRVMVFPQNSKYENSFEQPYFEMMTRFQEVLRKPSTLLITIGFSFIDKHISSVILESLKHNPALNLMAFSFPEVIIGGQLFQNEIFSRAHEDPRVFLIAEKFEDLAREFPDNLGQKRHDLLEELNDLLRAKQASDAKGK